MEGNPIDTSVVSLENKFYHRISIPKHIRLVRIGAGHLVLECHGSRSRVLLSEAGDIPDSNGLIEGCGHNQVFLRVELRTHSVMIMPGHGANYSLYQQMLPTTGHAVTHLMTCSANSISESFGRLNWTRSREVHDGKTQCARNPDGHSA